jgi:hypothetical protein
MKRLQTRRRRSSRSILIAIAAGGVLALGFILALGFLARSGSAHHETVVTQAPDDHPAAAGTGDPDLHFTTTSVDLGVVPLGTEVGYAFSYANIGAKALEIEDVNVRAVRGC